MAKRFIDTKIWDKAWFRKLSTKNKLVWIYLLGKCDHAGIWDADWELAEFIIGESVTYDELPNVIKDKMEHIKGEEQYFIPSFIDFQYGELKEHSKPHMSVLKRLNEKHLKIKGLKRVSITPKDKDKVKVKKKDKKIREQEFSKKVNIISKDIENISDAQINNFIYYWTESNANGRRLKFEMQKTFDIKRRLVKWRDNNIEWGKPNTKTNQERKQESMRHWKSKFKYVEATGVFIAYCKNCGNKLMPTSTYQLSQGSSCCSVEFVSEKPLNV